MRFNLNRASSSSHAYYHHHPAPLPFLLNILLSALIILSVQAQDTAATGPAAAHTDLASQAFFQDPNQQLPVMSAIRRSAPLVFPAPARHTATVIFAHGLGDTGHGWASAVENWRRRQRLDEVKFILPHAPSMPITANYGMSMPGWFDIKSLDGSVESLRAKEDEPGVTTTTTYLHSLIQSEIDAGIPASRIVLGGFSQGGAMALYAGLTSPHQLAAVVGLSCWLVLGNKFTELVNGQPERFAANKKTPVWMGHGGSDPLVRTELGKMSADGLQNLGFDVTWKVYAGMPHSACPEELDDVEEFLSKNLPPQPAN